MKAKYEVRFTPSFRRRLKALNRQLQIRILHQTQILKTNPHIGKPLRGPWRGIHSLRIGDYRILYQISDNKIYLLTVGHRKRVYKG